MAKEQTTLRPLQEAIRQASKSIAAGGQGSATSNPTTASATQNSGSGQKTTSQKAKK